MDMVESDSKWATHKYCINIRWKLVNIGKLVLMPFSGVGEDPILSELQLSLCLSQGCRFGFTSVCVCVCVSYMQQHS